MGADGVIVSQKFGGSEKRTETETDNLRTTNSPPPRIKILTWSLVVAVYSMMLVLAPLTKESSRSEQILSKELDTA